MVRVTWDGCRFLVWHSRDAYELRYAHRIVGSLVGALPTHKRQTVEHGLPLVLAFEEALLVAEEGIAEVVDGTSLGAGDVAGAGCSGGDATAAQYLRFSVACDAWAHAPLATMTPSQLRAMACGASRLVHAQVFRALWARGLYTTPGACFGSDYLCYPGDPIRHHAHLLVHVARPGRPMRGTELACAARLATSVRKAAVIAQCDIASSTQVQFTPVDTSTEAACVGRAGGFDDDGVDESARVARLLHQLPAESGAASARRRESRRRPRANWEESASGAVGDAETAAHRACIDARQT